MAARPVCTVCRAAQARRLGTWIGLMLAVTVVPALAQYKVVAPDGTVTYTDRPMLSGGKVAEPLRGAGAAGHAVDLPYALRQVVARYPVTLYTAPACVPCDAARQLLLQRGVPVTERGVPTNEDVVELRRLEQTTDLPILRLGAQRLVGFSADEWSGMLDAAGYPRVSVLPAGYRQVTVQPLVAARAVAPDAVESRPTATPGVPPPTAAGVGGIRF